MLTGSFSLGVTFMYLFSIQSAKLELPNTLQFINNFRCALKYPKSAGIKPPQLLAMNHHTFGSN